MKLEDQVQSEIRLDGAKVECDLLRNNSGAVVVQNRQVRFGLGNEHATQTKLFKSSDLIGCMPLVITPEMVGSAIGVFVAVEVKKEDWKWCGDAREVGQLNFINWVRARGGFAGFANSVDTFRKIIGR